MNPLVTTSTSKTALTAAIRAIDPGGAQAYVTVTAEIPARLRTVAALDREEDQTGNQVGNDQHPANRGNSQIIIKCTLAATD